MVGYFLTPAYKSDHDNQDPNPDIPINIYSFSDKHYALPFGISLMSFGFLVVLITFLYEYDQHISYPRSQ